MRVGVAILFVLLISAYVSSKITPFEEIDPVEQEIVRNAIKNHWIDLKNYKLKPQKPHVNMSDNLMMNIHKIKFRPPHPNATKIAMSHVIQQRIIKEAESKLKEIQGTERTKRQLLPGSLSPSSLAVIYQAVECEEFLPRPNCDRRSLFVRNIDGTCNNLIFQSHGATFDIFSRLLPALYEDGIEEPRGFQQPNPFQPPLPSARSISLSIHQNGNSPNSLANVDEGGLTHLVMQWGQFIDHDTTYLIEAGEGNEMIDMECWESDTHKEPEFCANIPVARDDPIASILNIKFNRDTLPFERSAPSCFVPLIGAAPKNREIINQLTSTIDASMVYGSTREEEESLRLFRGGLLLELADQPSSISRGLPIESGTLPISPVPTTPPCVNGLNCFLAGDRRVSEQFSLSIMHTVWLREHNRIAKEIARLNQLWSDEAIFQVARRIVGAEIQNIVYNEYLPVLLGSNNVQRLIGPYLGYNASADPRASNEFATAAYRFGHSQIRSGFFRFDSNWNSLGELRLLDAFFNSRLFFDSHTGGVDPIIRGLVNSQSRRLDEFINAILTNKLFANLLFVEEEITPPLDLAARNIQRGRDHGLPTYLQARRFCKSIFDIESPIASSTTLRRLQTLYGRDLDFADLFPLGLSEQRLPGSLLGSTFSCIVGLTFKNLRDGDRFYFENEGVFTSEQLESIREISIASVLCENTKIGEIQREAFRTGTREPCRNIPRLNLDLFQNDQIGEMIQNNDFSRESFPGQRDTIRLNNEFRAYLTQQQADLTAVNDLNSMIGSSDAGIVAYLKVELSPLQFSNPVIRDVTVVSILRRTQKRDRTSTEFETGRSSGPAAACLRILASMPGSETRITITPETLSSSSCQLSLISTGLNNEVTTRSGSVTLRVPTAANENDGIYSSEDECKLGQRSASSSGGVLRPTIGVGVKFTC
ncbi:Peroxidasin [Oopsacas minuta]|uniref:Peroxidasin n=1 Tax=Oopsacas minuta TaxID=111878 RepID=A0AAV7K3W6_9METZ|nr:Peroxidasin [Oopsacas minuta]